MKLDINILRQPFTNIPRNINIFRNIETLEQLTESLFSVDNFNTCSGVVNINDQIAELGHSATFQDTHGTWRHKKCLLVLFETSEICKFCRNVTIALKRKHYRVEMAKSIKRIKFTMSTNCASSREKLILLRRKYYKAERARKRAKYVADKLHNELMNCVAKVKEISEETIEDRLKKRNIPKNQMCAMLEIAKAAKCANPKSRRYNEEWVLMCMLMHMKSPNAYEFLRNNEILPVPCVQTIRR